MIWHSDIVASWHPVGCLPNDGLLDHPGEIIRTCNFTAPGAHIIVLGSYFSRSEYMVICVGAALFRVLQRERGNRRQPVAEQCVCVCTIAPAACSLCNVFIPHDVSSANQPASIRLGHRYNMPFAKRQTAPRPPFVAPTAGENSSGKGDRERKSRGVSV